MIGQLNNGVCPPTLFAADAIISDPFHRSLVVFNRGKKFANLRLLGVAKGSAGGVQRILHTATLAAFAKRHSALDLVQSRRRALRYIYLSRRHLLAPALV